MDNNTTYNKPVEEVVVDLMRADRHYRITGDYAQLLSALKDLTALGWFDEDGAGYLEGPELSDDRKETICPMK